MVPPAETPSGLPAGAVVVQPAAAGGVPVEWRLGGGPDEAGGASLSRRRRGGPTGRRSRCSSTASRGGRRTMRERWRKGWAICSGEVQAPAAGTVMPSVSLPAWRETITPRSGRRSSSTSPGPADAWGSPHSPYACAHVLTRAHTERACSPLALDVGASELRPLSPSPYGDTVGGWFAWHLAETRPRFRQFDPARARGGLQRVARRPGGRGPPRQGAPSRRSSTACRRASRRRLSGTRWKPCQSLPTCRPRTAWS